MRKLQRAANKIHVATALGSGGPTRTAAEKLFIRRVQDEDAFDRILLNLAIDTGLSEENLRKFMEPLCFCCWHQAQKVVREVEGAGDNTKLKEQVQGLQKQVNELNLSAMKQISNLRAKNTAGFGFHDDEDICFHEPLKYLDDTTRELIMGIVNEKVSQIVDTAESRQGSKEGVGSSTVAREKLVKWERSSPRSPTNASNDEILERLEQAEERAEEAEERAEEAEELRKTMSAKAEKLQEEIDRLKSEAQRAGEERENEETNGAKAAQQHKEELASLEKALQESRRAESAVASKLEAREREIERLSKQLGQAGDKAAREMDAGRNNVPRSPDISTIVSDTARAEAPRAEPFRTDPPGVAASRAVPPRAENPRAEVPRAETSHTAAPSAEAARTEAPQADARRAGASRAEALAPRAEAPCSRIEAPRSQALDTTSTRADPRAESRTEAPGQMDGSIGAKGAVASAAEVVGATSVVVEELRCAMDGPSSNGIVSIDGLAREMATQTELAGELLNNLLEASVQLNTNCAQMQATLSKAAAEGKLDHVDLANVIQTETSFSAMIEAHDVYIRLWEDARLRCRGAHRRQRAPAGPKPQKTVLHARELPPQRMVVPAPPPVPAPLQPTDVAQKKVRVKHAETIDVIEEEEDCGPEKDLRVEATKLEVPKDVSVDVEVEGPHDPKIGADWEKRQSPPNASEDMPVFQGHKFVRQERRTISLALLAPTARKVVEEHRQQPLEDLQASNTFETFKAPPKESLEADAVSDFLRRRRHARGITTPGLQPLPLPPEVQAQGSEAMAGTANPRRLHHGRLSMSASLPNLASAI